MSMEQPTPGKTRAAGRETPSLPSGDGTNGKGGPGALLRVVILEDLQTDVELILRELHKSGIGTVHEVAETADSFLQLLDRFDPDIVLSDYSMPRFDGMTALEVLQEHRPDIPFIIVTGSRNEEIAVECMKAGAADYMIKENLRRLGPAVMAALEKYRLKREKDQAEEAVRRSRDELEDLVRQRTLELEERNRKLAGEIAERKRAQDEKERIEAQLVQAQKIEALGRFAGGIAHDLNNILYPIIINTELLLDETEPGTSTHEMLDQTLRAAQRQKGLVKQILSFSRQSDQRFSPTKVVPLVEESLDFIRSSLPSSIGIRQHIHAPLDTVFGDPTQIQQIIMNLCRNAADALESQQGVIEVSLTNTCLGANPAHPGLKPGTYLELRVRDTGYGMRPDVLERIFEPFYTTKGVGKGIGMGLSVVHGILKTHNGAVIVESDPGKGSQFTVYLPVSDGRSDPVSPEACLLEEEKKRILLVDDEEIILSSMQRALERSGYAVQVKEDSGEALALFAQDPDAFDLVITDLTMPGLTGVTLTRRLKDMRPDLPIILCTGFTDMIDEQEAKSLGISELLLKPAGTGEIKAAVRRVLEGAPG